jgi:hypothetical protein
MWISQGILSVTVIHRHGRKSEFDAILQKLEAKTKRGEKMKIIEKRFF